MPDGQAVPVTEAVAAALAGLGADTVFGVVGSGNFKVTNALIGLGVETVGTDAGTAHSFDPPFPCHAAMLGAGKYGLTQLQNLALLPPQGAVVIALPLPITGGSGSPCRALALVERA